MAETGLLGGGAGQVDPATASMLISHQAASQYQRGFQTLYGPRWYWLAAQAELLGDPRWRAAVHRTLPIIGIVHYYT